MTFDPKDKTHKAQLYIALVAAAELESIYFDDFLQIPFDTPWSLAQGYRRNLQRGDYSTIRARVLYDWMMEHHFTTAHKFAPAIFPVTPEMRLRWIVTEHALQGQLRIRLVTDELGIVQRRSMRPEADYTLKLGQAFYCELDADAPGYVALFQVFRNQWHPIPLQGEEGFSLKITGGIDSFPQTLSGQIDPIEEPSDTGPHMFVAIATQETDLPMNVDGVLKAWAKGQITLHKLNVRFVR